MLHWNNEQICCPSLNFPACFLLWSWGQHPQTLIWCPSRRVLICTRIHYSGLWLWPWLYTIMLWFLSYIWQSHWLPSLCFWVWWGCSPLDTFQLLLWTYPGFLCCCPSHVVLGFRLSLCAQIGLWECWGGMWGFWFLCQGLFEHVAPVSVCFFGCWFFSGW